MAEIMKEKLQAAIKAAKNSKPVDEEELFRVRLMNIYLYYFCLSNRIYIYIYI